MDRIYFVLNEIQNGTKSPKQLFDKVQSLFKNNLVEYQIFLNDIESEAYIKFLGGNNSPKYGDIIITDKGTGYLEDNKPRFNQNVFSGPCNTWRKMKCKEQFITNIDELCNTCFLRTKIAGIRANMIMKIETLKSVNSKEYVVEHLKKEIENDNKIIADMINVESTGSSPYRENRIGVLLSYKDCIQYYYEQLNILNNSKSTVTNEDKVQEYPPVTIAQALAENSEDIWKKEALKMGLKAGTVPYLQFLNVKKEEEKHRDDEVKRKKDFTYYVGGETIYCPTLEKFKQQLTIQKMNPDRFKYMEFLWNEQVKYTNAKRYYDTWGGRGTGIDRHDLYGEIIELINFEIDKGTSTHVTNFKLENVTDAPVNLEKKETDTRQELIAGNTERLKSELTKYGFYTLEFVKDLQIKKTDKLIGCINGSELPYQIAMLDYLGFIEHLGKEHFTVKNKLYDGIAEILNTDARSVKGNVLVLSPISKENRERYTAHLHKQTVEKEYLNIK